MAKHEDRLPEKLRDRLLSLYGTEEYRAMLKDISHSLPTTLRRNPNTISTEQFDTALTDNGITATPVSWYLDARIVDSQNSVQSIGKTDGFQNGVFYVQSLSSMIPPLVLDPKRGEKILDLCASPGSKTTQIAGMIANNGEIVANDVSYIRTLKLKANIRIQNATCVTCTNLPGEKLWTIYPEYFDKTLVDVPCSMEGTIRLDNPKTYEHWSPKKVKELSKKQRWLLRSAISATKPGGTIVYSTCTLSPEENEEIIDWICEKEKGNIKLEEISITGLKTEHGILSWNNHSYTPEVASCIRIRSSDCMEGFFVAKIKKIRSTVHGSLE